MTMTWDEMSLGVAYIVQGAFLSSIIWENSSNLETSSNERRPRM